MKHTEIALHRPVTTVVVFVAMAMVGLIASRLLPLEKFPDIEFPGIFVQIPYEGSTPEEVERLITRPVEEVLATLSGVERMFSSSSEGQSQIFLQFGWDESMGAKGIEARAKVDGIRHLLPEDIRRIFVFTGSLGDQPVLELRISSERDLSGSYELLDRILKRRLERLEGVSRVDLHGVDAREIRILLKPDMLAAYGVDIASIRDLMQNSNFAVSAGKITAGGERFSVRPSGEFTSVEEIRELTVTASGLRLRDVADVELRTPDRNYGRHLDRDYAIGVSVNKTTGSNLVDVTDRVIAEVEKIGKLPQMQGINIFALDNQGDSVRESLADLLSAGALGGLLAIIVLYLFLRQVTTTLIVTAAVPFSLLITLGALYFAGLTLNILSMRPDAQYPVDDGSHARCRHAGGQCRGDHRERVSASGGIPGAPVQRHNQRRQRSRPRRYSGYRYNDYCICANCLRYADRYHDLFDARGSNNHRCTDSIPADRANARTNVGRAYCGASQAEERCIN
jgi:HAE1 family hydrophobic/amphiphilic exporter-1